MIEILAAAGLVTVQDAGRTGHAHLGVPRAGALDAPALRLANRLVGNPPEAAALEITAAGLAVRARTAVTVALTGAPAGLTRDGRPVPYGAPVPVPAGAVLAVGPARYGLRSYLALAGGVAVPPVLGSRSTDTLSGLGPAPLRPGDLLPLGPAGPWVSTVDFVPATAGAGTVRPRVRAGPRAHWFTPAARRLLVRAAYTVTPVGNRVGVRLAGPVLDRAVPGELPSEPLVCGAVQVPGGGTPLVFLADHPTTGGYPVIAVLHPDDLPLLAQAVPGTTVRFRPAPGY